MYHYIIQHTCSCLFSHSGGSCIPLMMQVFFFGFELFPNFQWWINFLITFKLFRLVYIMYIVQYWTHFPRVNFLKLINDIEKKFPCWFKKKSHQWCVYHKLLCQITLYTYLKNGEKKDIRKAQSLYSSVLKGKVF